MVGSQPKPLQFPMPKHLVAHSSTDFGPPLFAKLVGTFQSPMLLPLESIFGCAMNFKSGDSATGAGLGAGPGAGLGEGPGIGRGLGPGFGVRPTATTIIMIIATNTRKPMMGFQPSIETESI